MKSTKLRNLLSATGAALLAISGAVAQTPHHAHYQDSPETHSASRDGQLAPRLQNLGDWQFPVSTDSPLAQQFINQGLTLAYGFNHAEAARAFREASRLDPTCAMAYWGQALVLGPNINMPMAEDSEPKAWELIQKAIAHKAHASERERDYIDALAKRYSDAVKPDRKALDKAYAAAMSGLSGKYPDDVDAATLNAEALMDLRPWDYWTRDGSPYAETVEITRLLESVLQRRPDHPGANHFYIHAMEASRPQMAEAAADRLRTLAPGAGHLVHMPSHIYIRIGRYTDAVESNRDAIKADEDYITQCRAQGIYPLAYYPHNVHFLWSSTTMQGKSRESIAAARKIAEKIPPEEIKNLPILQAFLVVQYFALARFGEWDQILKEPKPTAGLFSEGMWRYARAMALMRKDRLPDAEKELAAIRRLATDKALIETPATFSSNSTEAVFRIVPEIVAGELAAEKGDYEEAVARLTKAVRLQDALNYTEPPDWHYPVRLSLGAVLLKAGRPVEAEVVYWEDLRHNPENGWALFGLAQALRAQGKTEQADQIDRRFAAAWASADVKLAESRF